MDGIISSPIDSVTSEFVKVGIVGLGAQGRDVLLPTLQSLKEVRIDAICDRDPQLRKEVSGQASISKAYANIEEILQDDDLDCLVVACPPDRHYEIAIAALEAQKPVFIEKPPATNLGDLRHLVELSEKLNIVNGVGMNFRFATAIQKIKQLIDTNAYGTPATINIKHLAGFPRQPMWGVSSLEALLFAQTIHPVDLAIYLAGQPAHFKSRIAENDGKITIFSHIGFESGTECTVITGNAAEKFYWGLEVITNQGAIIECRQLWEVNVWTPSHREDFPSRESWRNTWTAGPLDRGFSRVGYRGELSIFLDCVRTKKRFTPSFSDLIPTYGILSDIAAQEIQRD